jgi:YbbR domain-containing protein
MRGRQDTLSQLGRGPGRLRSTAEMPRVPDPLDREPGRRGTLGGWIRGALFDNAGIKLLALILALTVYLLVNTDEHREINARVRVAYVLPPDKALVSERIDEVRVTIRGRWRRIKQFDEREIDRIDIDLTGVTTGEVVITPDMIDLPRGLEITSIHPKVIHVAFEEMATKRVPILPSFGGRPLQGYQVVAPRSSVDPPMITVRGAAGVVDELESVRTREIRVDGRSEDFVATVQPLAEEGVELDPEGPVEVQVVIEEELVTRRLGSVPVELRAEILGFDPSRWRVAPAKVDVMLTGPVVTVEEWMDEGIHVVAIVPPEASAPRAAGSIEVPVMVDGAPPGVGVRVSPEKVVVSPGSK